MKKPRIVTVKLPAFLTPPFDGYEWVSASHSKHFTPGKIYLLNRGLGGHQSESGERKIHDRADQTPDKTGTRIKYCSCSSLASFFTSMAISTNICG
jgi:hypothetical protein